MANEEQLQILNLGVEAWNHWRKENPEVLVDLKGVNLQNEKLKGINFSNANLTNANLQDSDLTDADLRDAHMPNVDLSRAIVNHADLTDAWLTGARLWQSHFEGSILSGANFEKADLWLGFLNKATLSKTNFTEANLVSVKFDDAKFHATIFLRAVLDNVILDGATIHARLDGAHMRAVWLRGANAENMFLASACLDGADLTGANFRDATLADASLVNASLVDVDLRGANLNGADLSLANLSGADLTGADLGRTTLVQTNIEGANFTACRVYGCSVWDLIGEPKSQKDLIITSGEESGITTDDIEVAQFIYLMLNNRKVRDVIDTVTSKTVLILGRFTKKRKKVLDAIREELRNRNYLPIIFDFDKPSSRNLTETVTLLARMARFIIADLTNPKSIPQELSAIIPDLPSVPVVPIILSSQTEYSMFENWFNYAWVLDIYKYDSGDGLLQDLKEKILVPAEAMVERRKPKSVK